MLQIRKKDNSVEKVDGFIEVVTPDGQIGLLIYEDASSEVHIVNASDEEAKKYCNLFGVEFCPMHKR
jgi:hypothetical protein